MDVSRLPHVGRVQLSAAGVFFSALLLSYGVGAPGHAAGPVISEFLASNQTSLEDEDGGRPDWIEIFHSGAEPITLGGWALTDDVEDLQKWVFPDVELTPGQFLIVFASGKDRRDPDAELHTNFKLSSDGEFLALVDPALEPVTTFAPEYPPQLPDTTFGLHMQLVRTAVVPVGAEARYTVPLDDALGLTWTEADFNDAAWLRGPSGIGYDRTDDASLLDLVATDVGDLVEGVNPGIYVRFPFDLSVDDVGKPVVFRIRHDDGYLGYINGVPIAEENVRDGDPVFDLRAVFSLRGDEGRTAEETRLFEINADLRVGQNVLAIHGMNTRATDTDLLVLPELEQLSVSSLQDSGGSYFRVPSPRWPNDNGLSGIAEQPVISLPGGTFPQTVTVEATVEDPATEIRFTTDGSEPTEESELYTGPVVIAGFSVLQVRGFKTGLLPSRISSESYSVLSAELQEFSSNLPIFVVNTPSPIPGAFLSGRLALFDVGADGRARFTETPDFQSNAAFKARGSSTAGRPKQSLSLELRDEKNADRSAELLGLPEDSDWILYGAYNFDLALLRNPFIYDLSNQMGRYAARSVFCEVYVNTTSDPLSNAHYHGVYSFMEKIKRGDDRVDVEELQPEHIAEPEVTGGYMFKIDRLDPGDQGFPGGGRTLGHVFPKERDIQPEQTEWIGAYLDEFWDVVRGEGGFDPTTGYAAYIDVESWLEHHLINNLAKNVDALRLSTYYHKRRGERVEAGPIWDFDRAMGSTDGRDRDPFEWSSSGGTDMFGYPWWRELFADPAFSARYAERWFELREDVFSIANMHATIDGMAAEIAEAQARNFERWGLLGEERTWEGQVDVLKNWLAQRAEWMDEQLVPMAEFSRDVGPVPDGFELSIAARYGTIYYTVDGPDPRGVDGLPVAEARTFTNSIPITGTNTVRARVLVEDLTAPGGGLWGALSEGTYIAGALRLNVTEIMYDPGELPDDQFRRGFFEFVELFNFGDEPIDLTGVRLTMDARPVFDFTESAIPILAPGEYIVVSNSLEAFATRYGDDVPLAGETSTPLGNRAHRLRLSGPQDEPLVDFVYDGAWYPEAAAGGRSIVLVDPSDPVTTRTRDGWKPSSEIAGSPGRADGELEPEPRGLQRVGDISQDNRLNLLDGLEFANFLVGSRESPCTDAAGTQKLADINGDGGVNLTDLVQLLNFLFANGAPPTLGLSCVPMEGCASVCESG